MDKRDSQVREASIITKRRFHLGGQFASRLKYQTSERAMLRQTRHDRQSERRGLASAGLRGADQIFSAKHNGKRAELDRRWLDKAHCLRSAHYFRRKFKLIK